MVAMSVDFYFFNCIISGSGSKRTASGNQYTFDAGVFFKDIISFF